MDFKKISYCFISENSNIKLLKISAAEVTVSVIHENIKIKNEYLILSFYIYLILRKLDFSISLVKLFSNQKSSFEVLYLGVIVSKILI